MRFCNAECVELNDTEVSRRGWRSLITTGNELFYSQNSLVNVGQKPKLPPMRNEESVPSLRRVNPANNGEPVLSVISSYRGIRGTLRGQYRWWKVPFNSDFPIGSAARYLRNGCSGVWHGNWMYHLVRVTLSLRCRRAIGGTLPRISAIPFVPRFSWGHVIPPAIAPIMCRRQFEKVRSRPIERRLPDRRTRRPRTGQRVIYLSNE